MSFKTAIKLIAFFFLIVLSSCRTPSQKEPPKIPRKEQSMADQKPTLTVSILPEEPTRHSQIVFIVNATDDSMLNEKSFFFPALNLGISTMLSQIKPIRELHQIDSLVPHLLSENNAKKLGDSFEVKVSVYDFPHRQEASVTKIIKLKKEER